TDKKKYTMLLMIYVEMVNAWFAERVHTIPVCKEGTKSQSESCACHQPACPETTNSGTPARKISASEFDRPLRPIFVKDSVGAVSFLSGSEKKEQMPLQSPRTGTSAGDRCSRLLELVKDISSHLDVTALCHKIFLHIHELIAADRYSLFLVCEDSSNEKFLVSRLFDVAEGSTLEEASNNCIRLEWNKGIVGHVAAIGQPLNIKNAYEDPRFNAEVDQITGYKTQSILCMPIKNHREEVVGVAQAINKKSGTGGTFTEQDEKLVRFSQRPVFQVLLDLASLIFEEQQSLEVILKKIAATIISFMQVQRCTIFIVDEDCTVILQMSDYDTNKINYMYAQYVKNTMEPLNIPDVCKDRRFPWTTDSAESVSQHIKSLLCTPIKNGKKNKVIGVCQLVNKMEENSGKIKAFNRNDEQFLEAFVIFCGLGIQNTQMYEAVERAMAKQMVTLEVLSYHASAAEEETRELQVTAAAVVPSAQSLNLTDFNFSDFELSDFETTLCTIRMFTDLNLVQNFQMKHEHVQATIIRNCEKSVMFHCSKKGKYCSLFSRDKLTDLETLALLIATLSHDLDHRGVNNSYIQRSEHPLAQLYCHSIMEHHHFDQCLMILNSPVSASLLCTLKGNHSLFSMLMTACDLSAITKPWPVQQRIAELVATEFFDQGDKERKELNIEPTNTYFVVTYKLFYMFYNLFQALTHVSEACYPLLDGCRKNRQKWQSLAEQQEKNLINGESNQAKRN
uniref:Phosphodiesterase n=2 Tax=Pavo cristatus TaxID=9049 RepID=A0A8C9FR51_PAVCR